MPPSKTESPPSATALLAAPAASAAMSALTSCVRAAAAGQEEICLIQAIGLVGIDNFINAPAHEGMNFNAARGDTILHRP